VSGPSGGWRCRRGPVRRLGSDWAMAVTGIGRPWRREVADKPVGQVHFAVAAPMAARRASVSAFGARRGRAWIRTLSVGGSPQSTCGLRLGDQAADCPPVSAAPGDVRGFSCCAESRPAVSRPPFSVLGMLGSARGHGEFPERMYGQGFGICTAWPELARRRHPSCCIGLQLIPRR